MKTALFLFFAVLLPLHANATPEFQLGSNWKQLEREKDFAVYEDAKEKSRSLTVVWGAMEENEKELTRESYPEFVSAMSKTRAFVNLALGIEDWKIESSDLQSEGDQRTLVLSGSYLRDGKTHKFWERQIFKNRKYYQLKFECVSSSSPTPEELAKIFEMVKLP